MDTSKRLLYSISLVSLTALLAACDNNAMDSLNTSNHNNTQNANLGIYCVRELSPISHSLCSVAQSELTDPNSKLELRLFWKPSDTLAGSQNTHQSDLPEDEPQSDTFKIDPLYKFDTLKEQLPATVTLKFAANAGMYNSDFAPIGYTILQGKEIRSLNLNEGGGNFHLMPNGVLWWDKQGKVSITESQTLQELLDSGAAEPWYATQSGPMLVIDGEIHPQFNADSTSIKFRNGVGVCQDGMIKFVNSDEPVNFYNFASLFKDTLDCPNALFLDGGVASALYAPDIHQQDDKNMGVMVGLIENLAPKN